MNAPVEVNAALRRAVASFDPAAADFSRLSALLWDRVGQASVQVSKPEPGEWVLDACCGDGASAIPAARLVGSTGHVDAVDLSAPLVTTVATAAAELGQLTAYRADVLEWPGAPDREGAPGEVGRYDVVQCVLGIFFFADMSAGTERLIGFLRPGGRAALTIWRRGAMTAIGDRLAVALALVRGEPAPGPREPYLIERIATVVDYSRWLCERGLRDPRVVVHELTVALTPESAWLLVTGSGFRGMLHGLDDAQIDAVRTEYLALLEHDDVTEVDATTLIGTGFR